MPVGGNVLIEAQVGGWVGAATAGSRHRLSALQTPPARLAPAGGVPLRASSPWVLLQ
jgi:hypothetical protein